MKYLFYILSIVIISWCAVSIFSKINHPKGTPIAIFNKKLIELGDKKYKSKVIAEYLITNQGSADLLIESVVPDCHCTASTFTHTPIKPGDSTKIILSYDSSRMGVFQSFATVTTNSTQTTTTILVLRGNIIQ